MATQLQTCAIGILTNRLNPLESIFVLIRANSWLIHSKWLETPNAPILPMLPRIHPSIAQNKPNPQYPKTNATSFTPKDYTSVALRSAQKNKPSQTQVEANPRSRFIGVGSDSPLSLLPGPPPGALGAWGSGPLLAPRSGVASFSSCFGALVAIVNPKSETKSFARHLRRH